MAWLLDEDDALKSKLQDWSVLNFPRDTQIPIAVYFRFPDTEIRTRTFPHIAIDLVDVQFDPTRAQRGFEYYFNYDTELATPGAGQVSAAYDYPMPYNLIYQLACYARTPRDDRQMQSLLFQMFPEGYGYLNMANFDGTIRRADFVSSVRRDTVEGTAQGNKRLYRNIVTISVSSEFLLGQVTELQTVTQAPGLTVIPYINEPAIPGGPT